MSQASVARLDSLPWDDQLYRPLAPLDGVTKRQVGLVAIPYFAWANRGLESMRVWIPAAQ